ncbi:MAG TPA: hypothetical protein VF534_09235 [Paraburkholderia sp.]
MKSYGWLWKLTVSLEKAGLSVDDWHPPSSTPQASRRIKAFDASGPTEAVFAMAKAAEDYYPGLRGLGAWNGIEGPGGIVMTDLLNVAGLCTCEVDSDGIASLFDPAVVVAVLHDMTRIWPASSIQVGSYKYFARQQVFDDRPGAGWMLYLPREITHAQVPEARRLIPVMDGGHWKGTIVVSVDDGAFRIDNAEHVASANAIERRLVDLDLLPRFTDL